MVTPVGVRLMAPPVNRAVSLALTSRGVSHRDGPVLIACSAADEPAALEVVRQLGLDCQLVRNRSEMMIPPPGVTKGGGVGEALDDLGLSPTTPSAWVTLRTTTALDGARSGWRWPMQSTPSRPTPM